VKALGAIAVLAAMVVGTVLAARLLMPPETRPAATARRQSPAAPPELSAKGPESHIPVPKASAPPPEPERPAAPKPPADGLPKKPAASEPNEADSNSLHAALPPLPPELPPLKKLPRVAIIIDDVGYDRPLAEKFIDLHAGFTIAILPHSPHQDAIARTARDRGLETMLHLPMEPMEYPEINPGPGALLTSMSPDELLQVLEENLRAVPHAKGVNNHMGSKLTTRSEPIYQVFSVLKQRGLFFIDSRTTDASVCQPSARLLQLAFAQRDVFLDHVQEPSFIRKQLRELVRIARNKGEALGIAHPHPSTYRVLKEELPALRQQIEIVPASRLARVSG
jgi:polysaccharide deacetylase 2 family uncharacterized protein YibQ